MRREFFQKVTWLSSFFALKFFQKKGLRAEQEGWAANRSSGLGLQSESFLSPPSSRPWGNLTTQWLVLILVQQERAMVSFQKDLWGGRLWSST